MRSIWKGSINFGMVAIPAKLYSAADDRRVAFHQYHAKCGSRVSLLRWCPACEQRLETADIKRGYEISKSQHIILEETDFQSLPLKSLKQIEVMEFVDGATIDIRAFADCYFLSCEDVGAKAFRLFLKAMETAEVVAIAKLTYREREHLSAIVPYHDIMLLRTLHYADELRPYDELKPRQVATSDKEMEMALALIKAMCADFSLDKYHDEYREALEKLIEAKLSGVVTTPATEQTPASDSDIADALIKSLAVLGVK